MKARAPNAWALALVAAAAAGSAGAQGVSRLRCEGLVEPAVLDCAAPRFSWAMDSGARGARQRAYQLSIADLTPGAAPLAEIARVDSDDSQWVVAPGFKPKPGASYSWRVRVWDERGRDLGWSAPAAFAMGLMGRPWPAKWMGDGAEVPLNAAPPARYFRARFYAGAPPARARLYVSALGIVEPWLNGQRVGRDYFSPGWPDYRRRAYYVAYDVTGLARRGANVIGLVLGDGWYSGTLMQNRQAGKEPLVSAFLEMTDASGAVSVFATDSRWQCATGPITAQGIYFGESFDARLDDPGWCDPSAKGSAWAWKPVHVADSGRIALTARISPPVRACEEIRPVGCREVRPGVFLYDMGQNIVGWARLSARVPAGREVVMRFGEMLDGPDRIYTANLRGANATARYTGNGSSGQAWEPRFTYFGFRYVEVSGLARLGPDNLTGVVVQADLERIGRFECSNPLLNQLYANTLWSQRGNFLEIPTDCPQRDERLGWTGDAQVFSDTANYNYACGPFYRQWLASLRDGYVDDQRGQAGFPDVAPDTGGLGYGSAGWGDAAVIVPYVTWLHTGDRRLLEENFPAIQRWVEAMARDNPDGIRRSRRSYGDWLAPGFSPDKAPTPYVLIATAYFARDVDIARRVAGELRRESARVRDEALLRKVRAAFRREFIAEDGRVASDQQTAYLLAIGFDLVPQALSAKVEAQLARTFAQKRYHLATGFLGTPLVMPVLGRIGREDLAYRVLEQESYPGWLFSVRNGATTIWERWDGWTPAAGFNTPSMNSFNHYAYGSVVGWFYGTIAGLRPDPEAPGWRGFRVEPSPGGGLSRAGASVETPYGTASSNWRISRGVFELAVAVPPGTSARVSIPAASTDQVKEGGAPLASLAQASGLADASGRATFRLESGSFVFRSPYRAEP